MSPRPRRHRSLTESLLSIVLGCEIGIVFFAALAVFGLRVLGAAWAFGGGAVFVLLLLIAARAAGTTWGQTLGWILQVALVATGILQPALYVVGAVFLAFWVYCYVVGRRIDRRNAALAAEHPPA